MSALTTLPRVSKLWVIIPASLAPLFSSPDFPIFSDPTKSTRFSSPIFNKSSPPTTSVIFLMWCWRWSVRAGMIIEQLFGACSSPWHVWWEFLRGSGWRCLVLLALSKISRLPWSGAAVNNGFVVFARDVYSKYLINNQNIVLDETTGRILTNM